MTTASRAFHWLWNGPAWTPVDATPRPRPSAWWWTALTAYLALAILGLTARSDQGTVDGGVVAFHLSFGALMAAGLWLWWRRPATGAGHLMVFNPLVIVSGDLVNPFPDSRLITTFALGLASFGFSAYVLGLFKYPTGRPFSVWAWRLVVLQAIKDGIWNAGTVLFYDARGCEPCRPREPSYVYLGHGWDGLLTWNRVFAFVTVAYPVLVIALVAVRWLRSSPGARRALAPFTVAVAGSVAMGIPFFLELGVYGRTYDVQHAWYTQLGNLTIASATVTGVWAARRTRGIVADLVVELDRAPAGEVGATLARVLGDPSLQLLLWLPDRQRWTDEHGNTIELPEGEGRAVTMIGDRLAAIVHHPDLADQQDLLKAIGSAGRLALENERLHAQLQAQLAELRESRDRFLSTAEAERRRLERQLHDGAHRTLEQIDTSLGRLSSHVATPDGHDLLRETKDELDTALTELKDLARGIHPAVLTEQGLAGAIGSLAARVPIPVRVHLSATRLPAAIETAAYFVTGEALTNITRYANASHAAIDGSVVADTFTIRITDDGAGGADPGHGTGLAGLHDRIAALDGTLQIDSPPGGGTTLTARIPLPAPDR